MRLNLFLLAPIGMCVFGRIEKIVQFRVPDRIIFLSEDFAQFGNIFVRRNGRAKLTGEIGVEAQGVRILQRIQFYDILCPVGG